MPTSQIHAPSRAVALFTRAWIEIYYPKLMYEYHHVALFTRAWIEMLCSGAFSSLLTVALFTRAWIEIIASSALSVAVWSPSLRGRGLKFKKQCPVKRHFKRRPLCEGVD